MNIEWLNTNRYRIYPFKEDSDLQGLPNWCLVDFYLVDTIDDSISTDVTLVKAENTAGGIKLTFSYRETEFEVTTSDEYEVHTVELDYDSPDGQYKPIAHCVTGFGEGSLESQITFSHPPVILPTRIIRKPGGSGVSSITISEDVEPLPYDAEVEYLESTGTQYINTAVAPDFNSDFNISATASPLNNGRKVVIGNFTDGSSYEDGRAMYSIEFGGLSNNYPYCPRGWFRPNNQISYSLWGDAVTPYAVVNTQISYSFTSNICKLVVNGVEYSQSILKQTVNPPRNLRIFRDFRTPTGIIDNGCRIYAAKVIIADSIVGNFIPVRVGSGSSAVGYLYDRANPDGGPLGNGLYPNSGTGAFVIGPDKEQQQIGTSTTEMSATGRIHLSTGCNCALRIYESAVHADISSGEGTGKCCQQQSDDGCSSKLLFINGQTADSDGNITLSGASGITVYPGDTRQYTIPDVGTVTLPTVIITSTGILK